MNRRTQERRQSAATLGQIICACNEAKLRATIDVQELRIQRLESLIAEIGATESLSFDTIVKIDCVLPK